MKKSSKTCKLRGCSKTHRSLGWCDAHYMQNRRTGNVSLETRLSPNTYVDKGDHIAIGLRSNNGKITFYALIDKEDLALAKQYRWYRKENKYVYGLRGKKRYYLHRVVTKCPDGMVVNHWNFDELDCRKSNLSVTTQSNNAGYKRKLNGKFRYKGIEYRSDMVNKYTATIVKDGVKYRISGLETEEEAANAYDQLAIQLSGEYALTNFKYK